VEHDPLIEASADFVEFDGNFYRQDRLLPDWKSRNDRESFDRTWIVTYEHSDAERLSEVDRCARIPWALGEGLTTGWRAEPRIDWDIAPNANFASRNLIHDILLLCERRVDELVGRFEGEKGPGSGIALSTKSIANDTGSNAIFQIGIALPDMFGDRMTSEHPSLLVPQIDQVGDLRDEFDKNKKKKKNKN
jgi:hypothetical protein